MHEQECIKIKSFGYRQLDEFRQQSNLTRNQLGFWLVQRLDAADTSSNMGQLYQFSCDIDPTRFSNAFQKMIDSTDALRATFSEKQGVPHQTFAESLSYELAIVELPVQSFDSPDLEGWCNDRIRARLDIGERCFDSALLKLGDDQWAWYLCVHHIVIDAYSMNLIFNKVAAAYEATATTYASVDLHAACFRDYVERESEYRGSLAAARDSEFWANRSVIADEPVTFYGNSRTGERNRCQRRSIEVDPRIGSALLGHAKSSCGGFANDDLATLVTYLALITSLYLRISNATTITVGVPFHNRTTPAEKATIGLLMEVTPLSIQFDADDAFSELCRKWKRELIGAIRHYRYGSTNPPRSRRYDLMLNLVRCETNQFAEHSVLTRWIHSGHWNEAITIQLQQGGSASADVMYVDLNEEIFRSPFADHMVDHLSILMESMASDSGTPVSLIEMVAQGEKYALEVNRNTGPREIENDESIVRHFDRIRQEHPNKVALVDGERSTSYQELNATTDRVATLLRNNGALPGDCIGISIRRSAVMIETILGILKAGCSYVPIDYSYPPARIRQMIQDAGIQLLCTNSDRMRSFESTGALHLVDVDSLGFPGEFLETGIDHWRSVSASDCAYINFTSGSTGKPKGVIIPHGGVIRLSVNADYVDLGPGHNILHLSTISFDAATFDIWGALLRGGTLIVHPDGVPSTTSVRAQIELFGANIVFLTTSVFNTLVDEDISVFKGIDQLITGGEAASYTHFLRVKKTFPTMKLLNAYGPTECTTYTTCFEIPAAELIKNPIPIGCAIANTTAVVLDRNLNEVPVGVVGTLHVGGDGVATGYLSQPDLTKKKFVVSDNGRHRGIRLYDTGDRVRLMPSGHLDFVGRLDNQVKVRGIRIEIDEIEGTLLRIPSVTRSVVALYESGSLGKGLVAYVTLADNRMSASELRVEMSHHLPSNIIPRWFVVLDEFPIGATGKIDRQKLPAPSASDDEPDTISAARDSLDKELMKIWADILGIRVVGIDQNIFDLGGDSISAIKIAARISTTIAAVDAGDVFSAETVRVLANRIDDIRGTTDDSTEQGSSTSRSVTDQDMNALLVELEL